MASYIPPNEPRGTIYNPDDFPSSVIDPTINSLFYKKTGGTITGRVNMTDDMWFINSTTILPPTASNRIDIPAGTTLYIIGDLDLQGNRLNMLGNVSIIGNSSEVSSLTSTGLPTGQSLITSTFTLPIRNITFGCPDDTLVLSLSGDGTNGLDLFAVNFGSTTLSCGTIGTIANYSNVIITECAVLNAYNGITFGGTIGTVGINNSLFTTLGLASASKHIRFDNATITRRFRVQTSSFVVASTCFGISAEGTTSFPIESFILTNVNFSGAGGYLSGIVPVSNSALITNTIGVQNSAKLGYSTMSGNSSTTTISLVDTYVKATGNTTLSSLVQKFSQGGSVNRLTYTGAIQQTFLIQVSLTLTSGNNNDIGITIYKNGTTNIGGDLTITTNAGGRLDNVVYQSIILLVENDYLEVWVKNSTGANDILVVDLSFIVSII